MKNSRRRFIGNVLALGGATAISPYVLRSVTLPANVKRGITAQGKLLRNPPIYKGETINVQWEKVSVWGDMQTNVIGLNGYIGPTIVANKGDVVNAEFKNSLGEPLSVHWHGFELPEEMDGHPKDMFTNGESKKYSFKVKQRAGTYFYHSHAHEKTEVHVNRGFFGLFIVHDDEEKALNLPSGKRDIALAIQDVQTEVVQSSNLRELKYDPTFMDGMNGWLGNTILTNGTPNAYTNVDRAWHRLRLVNASGARIYKIALSTKQPFYVIASDGGLLEKPVKLENVWLNPGERYELLVDFSQVNVGESVSVVSEEYPKPPAHMGVDPEFPQGMPFTIVQCMVTEDAKDTFTIPSTLSTVKRYNEKEAKRTRKFELAMSGANHTINGKSFTDMMRVDEHIKMDELEIWEFINTEDDMQHPMHIHAAQFQILSRSSGDIPEIERGWKDVFNMAPKETVRILIRFEEFMGMYLLHCHNLAHEDHGMMINFEVTDASDIHGNTPEQQLQAYPNVASEQTQIRFAPSDVQRILTVTDIRGNNVTQAFIRPLQTEHTLFLNALSASTYWITVGNQSVQVIVQR